MMQGNTVKYWKRHARRRFAPEAWQWEPSLSGQAHRRYGREGHHPSRFGGPVPVRRAGVITSIPLGVLHVR